MTESFMWVEKYRPIKLSSIINQKEIVGSLKSLLKNISEMPHLMFSGSAGVGKTTTAICLAREILGDSWREYTLELNASDERGINMVRDRVKKFARFSGLDTKIPFKLVILDEADEMTSDAQTALRRIIEDTAGHCRFIMIANNISKIIEPLQSRCAVFKFTRISEEEIIGHLEEICKKEKIKYNKEGLKSLYSYSEGDMRHSINMLQATASLGMINEDNVKASSGLTKISDVGEILKTALAGKLTDARNKMVELIKIYGMSESDFLKYLNEECYKLKTDNLSEILESIAKYDYRLVIGANPEIQLSALLAELGKIGK
ncbi:Replication factor C small subunit [Candidatus Nitrosotalea sp. TS]|uniref:replication factor C small subunit n=1 Tax=Candidatus Nitrosotalea sp. TS TaxID=2341020 RepID=UPI0014097B49|nr:replication factor C small subunit [Candidatus Nitrosotalea sp. TS]NHI03463.1 Replication factor C small subunit [Candidatus Nitrosotalea sp. TS]